MIVLYSWNGTERIDLSNSRDLSEVEVVCRKSINKRKMERMVSGEGVLLFCFRKWYQEVPYLLVVEKFLYLVIER
jgi:hypothetical protein